MSYEQALRENYIAVRRRLYSMPPAKRPVQLEPKAHIRPYSPAKVAAQIRAREEAQRRLSKEWEAHAPAPYDDFEVVVPGSATRRIMDEVCAEYGTRYTELISPIRARNVVTARQKVCYRLRVERQMSWSQIGRLVGGQDHTTVLHSYRVHKARIEAS